MDVTLHTRKKLRTKSFLPQNANCVCLHSEGDVITIFDLPLVKALALAKLFADEDTRLYEKPGQPSKNFLVAYPAESEGVEDAAGGEHG